MLDATTGFTVPKTASIFVPILAANDVLYESA